MSGPWRHAGLIGRAGLLLSLAVRRDRLLLLTGPVQLTGRSRLTGAVELAWLLLSRALSLPVRQGRQRRLTGLPGKNVLPWLTRTVQLTGRLSGPDLSRRTVLPRLAGL